MTLSGYKSVKLSNLKFQFDMSQKAEPAAACGLEIRSIIQDVAVSSIEIGQVLPESWAASSKYCSILTMSDNQRVLLTHYLIQGQRGRVVGQPLITSRNNAEMVIQDLRFLDNQMDQVVLFKSINTPVNAVNWLTVRNNSFLSESSNGTAYFNLIEFDRGIDLRNFWMSSNRLRKCNVLTFVQSTVVAGQSYAFLNIHVTSNVFAHSLNGQLIGIYYSLNQQLDHSFTVDNLNYLKNTILRLDDQNPSLNNFIYLQKISRIDIRNVTVQQSVYNQGLVKASSVGNIYAAGISVSSYDDYLEYAQITASLLDVDNFNQADFRQIAFTKLKLNQLPAVTLRKSDESLKYAESDVRISDTSFQHIYLNASSSDQYTTCLLILTEFLVKVELESCRFEHLQLNVAKFSNIKQSAAVMVMAIQSVTRISRSRFLHSRSNSYVSFVYALATDMQFDLCEFSSSNYEEETASDILAAA